MQTVQENLDENDSVVAFGKWQQKQVATNITKKYSWNAALNAIAIKSISNVSSNYKYSIMSPLQCTALFFSTDTVSIDRSVISLLVYVHFHVSYM